MNKKLLFLLAALLATTLACSLFNGLRPTPTEEYYFRPYGPLAIAPDTLPEARSGEPYNVEILISQNETPVGNMSIAPDTLPDGLEFLFLEGENKAVISGVPQEAGVFDISLDAWCFGTMVSGQTIQKDYQLVVHE